MGNAFRIVLRWAISPMHSSSSVEVSITTTTTAAPSWNCTCKGRVKCWLRFASLSVCSTHAAPLHLLLRPLPILHTILHPRAPVPVPRSLAPSLGSNAQRGRAASPDPQVRLQGGFTSGFRTTILPLTFGGNSSKVICEGEYEVAHPPTAPIPSPARAVRAAAQSEVP